MTSCKEFELDDLMAVTAIPVTDFTPGTAAWQLKPVIPAGSFSPQLANAIVIGMQPATAGGRLIPIKRFSGKAKDNEADATAGRKHTVTVTCEADDRDLSYDARGETVLDYLLRLERTPSHLLLTFRDGTTKGFVAATRDTYSCEVERNGAKTSVSLKVEDLMGIQMITA